MIFVRFKLKHHTDENPALIYLSVTAITAVTGGESRDTMVFVVGSDEGWSLMAEPEKVLEAIFNAGQQARQAQASGLVLPGTGGAVN